MKFIVFIVSAFWIVMPLHSQQPVVADPPEVRGPFTRGATYDSVVGHNAFAYNGDTVPSVSTQERRSSGVKSRSLTNGSARSCSK